VLYGIILQQVIKPRSQKIHTIVERKPYNYLWGLNVSNQTLKVMLSLNHPKSILSLAVLWLGFSCLPVTAQTTSISSYGIGTAHSDSSGGSRCPYSFYPLVMFAPKDGGRSLSPHPTFYWYVAMPPESEGSARVDLILRDGNYDTSQPIFRVSVETIRSGLYKFTLPKSVRLRVGVIHRWQLRFIQESDTHNSLSTVLLTKNPHIEQEISRSYTELERAQIYAKHYYWYDALAAYSNWLDTHPKDEMARRDRLEMLQSAIGSDNKLKCGGGKYITTTEINAK
jgi:hypothetical protein